MPPLTHAGTSRPCAPVLEQDCWLQTASTCLQATTTPANDTIDGHKRPKVVDEEADAVSSSCDCNRDAAPVRWMWLVWICPALLWFGLCTHSVFEGLAVGLQVGSMLPQYQSKIDIISVILQGLSYRHKHSRTLL